MKLADAITTQRNGQTRNLPRLLVGMEGGMSSAFEDWRHLWWLGVRTRSQDWTLCGMVSHLVNNVHLAPRTPPWNCVGQKRRLFQETRSIHVGGCRAFAPCTVVATFVARARWRFSDGLNCVLRGILSAFLPHRRALKVQCLRFSALRAHTSA